MAETKLIDVGRRDPAGLHRPHIGPLAAVAGYDYLTLAVLISCSGSLKHAGYLLVGDSWSHTL